MYGCGFVCGILACSGLVRDFPTVEPEVPSRVGMRLRPVFMTEEDADGEDNENDDNRAHGIRVVVRGRVSYV